MTRPWRQRLESGCIQSECCVAIALKYQKAHRSQIDWTIYSFVSVVSCLCQDLYSESCSHSFFNQRLSTRFQHFQLSGSRSKSAVRSQRSLSVSRQPRSEGVNHNPKGPQNSTSTGSSWEESACAHKQHDSLQWCKTLNGKFLYCKTGNR